MRNLTPSDISTLQSQGCSSTSWDTIHIDDDLNIALIRNASFRNNVSIGRNTTINNAVIDNCSIGHDTTIRNIHNCIANYTIGNSVTIIDCSSITASAHPAFGIGTPVSAVNEAGGREVRLSSALTSNIAYIVAFHRYNSSVIDGYNALVDAELAALDHRGSIGDNCTILSTRSITDVNIGNDTTISNVTALHDGTILSHPLQRTIISDGAICRHFVIAEGANINAGAELHSCFVGQCSVVGSKFFAENCLIFANCQLLNGEAVSAFCGPFTVSHHKTSLLIAGYYSFFNAGSATNASNHHYRLGPSHQAIYNRGVKTGSGSYLLEPAHIGAYTMVIGHHKGNPDTSAFPFSYLINKGEDSYLLPAQNLKTIGLFRDELKWRTRDSRQPSLIRDLLTVSVLNPFTVSSLLSAISLSDALMDKTEGDVIVHKGYRIQKGLLRRARSVYQDIADAFIAEHASSSAPASSLNAETVWCDCGGLVIDKDSLSAIEDNIAQHRYSTVADIAEAFKAYSEQYDSLTSSWCSSLVTADLTAMRNKAADTYTSLADSMIADAKKELTTRLSIGYGLDATANEAAMEYEAIHPSDSKAVKQCREYYDEKAKKLRGQDK